MTTPTEIMLEPEIAQLLAQYGVPYPDHRLAETSQEAVKFAQEIGRPVVLKIVSPDVVHKSDAGGVLVGLATSDQVREGYARLIGQVRANVPHARIKGVLVCKEALPGLEAIVGLVHDPIFGPTVMFGLGGIYTEILQDVTFRIAPLTLSDAEEMIREIRGYPLLNGTRGQNPCDTKALTNLLLSVSQMAMDRGDIQELDLNPVRLYHQGLLALDARMMVANN